MRSSLRTLAGAGRKLKKKTPSAAKRGAAASAPSSSSAAAASAAFAATVAPSSNTALRAKKDMAGKLSFDASKAGLQKVDKAHVQKVIEEASKGTPFYLKEQRREEERRRRTELVLRKAEDFANLSDAQLREVQQTVDKMEAEMEAGRDLRRRYIHIDMDMFYAAVEEKKNPRLKELPFGVGSNAMLSTTNYVARQYGVRSGMPGFIGKKLCPELLIVPVDLRSYRREAAAIHSIASRYDVEFVSVGLDELTMDVTKYLEEFPEKTAAEIAEEFRAEILLKTRLTASAGIAPTTTLAKIASNVNKPNGQHEVVLQSRQEVLDYVKDVPLRKIPGIGYAQEALLNALGIKTCGDLLTQKYLLGYLFKEKTLRHYLATGLGVIETHAHRTTDLRQSVGKESSFSEPLPSREALQRLFRRLLEFCHMRCVREHLHAEQMQLVLKTRGYDVSNYSVSLPKPTNDLKLWLEASEQLLAPHLDKFDEYRLVGIRMRKLTPVPVLNANARSAAATGAPTTPSKLRDAEEDGDDDGAEEDGDRDDDDENDGDDRDDVVEKVGRAAKSRASAGHRSHAANVSDDPYEGYQDDEGAALKLLHRDGTRAVPLPVRSVRKSADTIRVIEDEEDGGADDDDDDAIVPTRRAATARTTTKSRQARAPVEKLKGDKLAAYKAMYEADDDDLDLDLDDDDNGDADEDRVKPGTPSRANSAPATPPSRKSGSHTVRGMPMSIPLSKPARYSASREADDDDDDDHHKSARFDDHEDEEEEVFIDAPPKVVKVATPTPAARKTVKKAASAPGKRPSRR